MDDTSAGEQPLELEKVRRHVRILVDLGRAAGETADLNRFLDQAVVQVARAVEIGHVKVLRYRRREADLLVAAGFGWKEGVVGSATLSADLRSPPGRSFQTAEPVYIRNFDEQQDFIISDLLRQHHIVSLVNVPVLTAGAAWGVLEIDSTQATRFQSGHDRVSDRRRRAHRRIRTAPHRRTERGCESRGCRRGGAEPRRAAS